MSKQGGIANGLIIYKMIISPKQMYFSTIQDGTFESIIHKFKLLLVQNKVMRKCTNVPIFTPINIDKVHEELGLPRVKDWYRETAINFHNLPKTSNN